jgi:non-heme chloroperoxidase
MCRPSEREFNTSVRIPALGNSEREKENTTVIISSLQTIRSTDGATIAFETYGEGRQTLLFLHGWGGAGTGSFWKDLLSHLDLTDLRVVLADLRGHGRSGGAEHGFSSEQFADDMFAVVDAVGAASAVVVGYSMSGRWAQWMACSQPARVRGQILIAPAPAADIPFPDELKANWLRVASDKNMDTFDPWVHQFTKERLAPETLQDYFEAVTSTPTVSLAETIDMCRQQGQFVDRLAAITAPTLVIGGNADPLLPPSILREAVVKPTPGARLVALDCGHEIPLERPQETAALIEAFVAGLGSLR